MSCMRVIDTSDGIELSWLGLEGFEDVRTILQLTSLTISSSRRTEQ